jgi:predicted esterase
VLQRLERDPSQIGAELLGRLAPLDLRFASPMNEDPGLPEALAICRARIELLADATDSPDTRSWLRDLDELGRQVEQEVRTLEQDRDPYRGRRGDLWRVVESGNTFVPMRTYLSAKAPANQPLPLVIAFHGLGGDENLFMDGYGAGALKRLADQHGFLAVAPLTTLNSRSPQFLDRLVDSLRDDYSIDLKRIYLLGHSMGTGPTAALAASRADRIAAVCCIAGGGPGLSARKLAPALLVTGALDPLFPPDRIRGYAERAKSSPHAIEFDTWPHHGHTLLVGDALPKIVEWLLQHRLNESSR